MDKNNSQPPKEFLHKKYLLFLLPVIAIILALGGYFLGRLSNEVGKKKQTEETKQPSPTLNVSLTPLITKTPPVKTSSFQEF